MTDIRARPPPRVAHVSQPGHGRPMSNAGAGPADGDARREEAYARFARIRVQTSPPPNEIPGILPIGQFLGRSATVAAVLLEIHAYAAGLEFRLTYRGHAAEHHPPFTPTDPGLAERIGLPVGTPPQVEVLLPDATQAVAIGLSDAARRLETLPGRSLSVHEAAEGTTSSMPTTG